MALPGVTGCRSDAVTIYDAGPIPDPCIILMYTSLSKLTVGLIYAFKFINYQIQSLKSELYLIRFDLRNKLIFVSLLNFKPQIFSHLCSFAYITGSRRFRRPICICVAALDN